MRTMKALLAAGVVACATTASAQKSEDDGKLRALGGEGIIENAAGIDRAAACPGQACTPGLTQQVERLTGLWQSDLAEFENAPADDPRSKATRDVHIMRLAANGVGTVDGSPDSGGKWCRAEFLWAVRSQEGSEALTLNRVFTEGSTCKRSKPGAAKPLHVKFVSSAHGRELGANHEAFQFVSRIDGWDDPIRIYYHKCDDDPLVKSTACEPLEWRPDVDVGAKHVQNMTPWSPPGAQ